MKIIKKKIEFDTNLTLKEFVEKYQGVEVSTGYGKGYIAGYNPQYKDWGIRSCNIIIGFDNNKGWTSAIEQYICLFECRSYLHVSITGSNFKII